MLLSPQRGRADKRKHLIRRAVNVDIGIDANQALHGYGGIDCSDFQGLDKSTRVKIIGMADSTSMFNDAMLCVNATVLDS